MRLVLQHVRKIFAGVTALDDISLAVPSGARVALVGPNGSGKSTLVRGVMGLTRCAGITIDGRDAFSDRAPLAARMAYVPQSAPQMAASVGELVRAIADVRALDAREIAGVAGALGLDLDRVRAQAVRTLSGGMKQKLMIALALAAPVSLLVLDEPTASLDAGTREAFFALCEERAAGATILLSSHRIDEVDRLTDRVIGLEAGRVIFDAAPGSRDVVASLAGDDRRGARLLDRAERCA
jgi:ABC-type multidrug transport system ATPase subunit